MKVTIPTHFEDRILRCNRISIDIDNQNRLKLLIAYYNMRNLTNNVRVYRTGGGYHIHGEFTGRTTKQNMDIRRALRDCEKRLELDELRQYTLDDESVMEMLFYKKAIKGKTTYEEPIYDITAPPFNGDGLQWSKH